MAQGTGGVSPNIVMAYIVMAHVAMAQGTGGVSTQVFGTESASVAPISGTRVYGSDSGYTPLPSSVPYMQTYLHGHVYRRACGYVHRPRGLAHRSSTGHNYIGHNYIGHYNIWAGRVGTLVFIRSAYIVMAYIVMAFIVLARELAHWSSCAASI